MKKITSIIILIQGKINYTIKREKKSTNVIQVSTFGKLF